MESPGLTSPIQRTQSQKDLPYAGISTERPEDPSDVSRWVKQREEQDVHGKDIIAELEA